MSIDQRLINERILAYNNTLHVKTKIKINE